MVDTADQHLVAVPSGTGLDSDAGVLVRYLPGDTLPAVYDDDGDGCVFRLLGPVQVRYAARPVTFSRRQQSDLLALLLLRTGHVIPVDHIVDAMWGQTVPRTAGTQVRNMVSGLRTALAHGVQPLAAIEWQGAGYRLRIRRGRLDLADFTDLLARAQAASAPQAVPLLRAAIGLWRGRQALVGVRANFADGARAYLDEKRVSAVEALFDAELACANHTAVVAELTEAVTQHPAREGLVAQLMTALYRSGRTSDALDAYRRARRVLVESYGLEPGLRLRELERRILRGDPSLDISAPPPEVDPVPVVVVAHRPSVVAPTESVVAPTGSDGPAVSPPEPHPPTATPPDRGHAAGDLPMPAQLPPDVRGFTARTAELRELDALLGGQPVRRVVIATLTGGAGVGKTALAVHWAHRVAHRFPDGQLYVNLHGFAPDSAPMSATDVLRGFLEALAVPPHRIPQGEQAQASLFRSLLAGRRILVLLDNAFSAEQVRPLLPAGMGCVALVTSRNRLSSLVVVEGAHPVTLDLLSPAEARDMLAARLGAARVMAEPGAAETIVARCARLPLALAVVAARAALQPRFPLAVLATQLAQASPLGVLGDADPGADVRAVFSWSYRRLAPDTGRLFRRLGLHPGPEIAEAAAASLVAGPLAAVRTMLAELVDAHLVAECSPGIYLLHDLLRAYAVELGATIDPEPMRTEAVGRMLDHYLYTGDAAAEQLHPHRFRVPLPPLAPDVTVTAVADRGQALAWFAREHLVLLEAVDQARSAGFDGHTWRLAVTIGIFVDRQGRWEDWIGALSTALDTARRVGDPVGQAHAHSGLGIARSRMRQYAEAHEHLDRALALFAGLGDDLGLAYAHLRMCAICEGMGRLEDSLAHAQRAHDLFVAGEHDTGRAQALNNLGWYAAQLGAYRDAVGRCEESVRLHRVLGDRPGTAHALDSLGYVYQRLGEFTRAATYYADAARILHETGDRSHAALALVHLGDARNAAGDVVAAREAWRAGHHILHELRHPDADRVAAKLCAVPTPGPATPSAVV